MMIATMSMRTRVTRSLDSRWRSSALVRRRNCLCYVWVDCSSTATTETRYPNGGHPPDTRYGSFLVYKRPFVEDFLKFCFGRFEVGLWSSAREWYVDNALDCIMPGLKQKLAFIWDQKKCTDSGFKCLDNKHKPVYLKELSKIWDNEDDDLPWAKGHYSAVDTLMIDDEPYKSLVNPANTAVFLSEYHADDLNDKVLGSDGALRNFLDGVVDADNVPGYVKACQFGRLAISSAHPDWDFYSKIIRKMKN